MNNSKIAFDNIEEDSTDRVAILQRQQGELTQVIEAIKGVEASADWQRLKRLILDDVVENIEQRLFAEVAKKEIDAPEIYRLQGQLVWAKKYTDLHKLGELFKQQIESIKLQLHEQTNPSDGAL